MLGRRRMVVGAFAALAALGFSLGTASAARPPAPAPTPDNALQDKAIATLDTWAGWLRQNKVRGYVGEVGWPNDDARWSPIAHAWYARAEAHDLPVTTWVTGEWPGNQQLANFVRNSRTGWQFTTTHSSDVMEAHPGTPATPHGVNISGPDMGAASIDATSSFSNENYGILDQTYHYDDASTMAYLKAHKMEIIRIPFRWERIQRTPFGPLDPDELSRLRAMVRRVGDAGMTVVLDLHNFGQYYLHDGTRGVRRSIGSAELPISAFTDVWTKLAKAFAAEPAVVALGLMNEPVELPSAPGVSPQKLWENASQAAVNAIRATGEIRVIMVGGYNWSGMHSWASLHPVAWINDPARNVMYEAHQYWNSNNSGVYMSYEQELAAAKAQGW